MKTTTSAAEFFYQHAGYSYDPATETPEIGRIRCAQSLADAERFASEAGWSVRWEEDPNADDECQCGDSHAPYFGAVLYDDSGEVLASLWGIGFADNGDPWDGDPYRRVVEAELADEAQAEIGA